jgi:hypothetical protein
MFGFSLQHLSETFLILRRIQRDVIINFHRSSRKVPSFLPDFNKTEFLRQIFEKYPNIFIKIRPLGAELFPAGGQTDRRSDMTNLVVAFRNFANEPKN